MRPRYPITIGGRPGIGFGIVRRRFSGGGAGGAGPVCASVGVRRVVLGGGGGGGGVVYLASGARAAATSRGSTEPGTRTGSDAVFEVRAVGRVADSAALRSGPEVS